MKAQTFIDKRSIFLRRKSGNGAKSRQKRSLKSWLVEFVLTRKKVCAHEKKGFTSREKRFHLTSANSPLGFSLFHCLFSCARFRDFCLFNPSLKCFERRTLRGVLDGKRVGANMCGNWVEFVPGILGVKCTKIGGRY